LLGTSILSFSKILNNMELGHNVMHGQYDWMQHPHLNSQKFDWDIVCPAPLWQHSHNYLHHTFTNIVGRDHDVGYHLIRVTDEQPWTPEDRYNMFSTAVLAFGFEWAVAFHDIQISVDEYADSPDLHKIMQQKSRALFAKIGRQVGKDYIALPAIAALTLGCRSAMSTLSGNIVANTVRNLWTWAVIFCGHFTEQAHIYTHLDTDESKGDWYVRQILGSSNIKGNKWFHILTGNLSHQIEHHIFPDMPASHYASIAPQVKAICHKYNLAYNTGRFSTQLRQVLGRIHHFSKPSEQEWQAYQSVSAADTTTHSHKSTPESEIAKGLSRFLPPVIRKAIAYAL
ncbi:MAG: fatty acid desaturase family protein, partial [Psychrobacter sp.]